MLKDIILLLRPQQWLKNLFIFVPLFFGQQATRMESLIASCVAFLAYSFAASAIYCFNDIYDVEADKKHPSKRLRPIASGRISIPVAYATAVGCLLVSAALVFCSQLDGWKVSTILAVYILLNIAYCMRLKHIAIIDVTIIATGFVLRLLVGSVATGIMLSHWVVLMTFLLALFLAFAKRRDDVAIYQDTGIMPRKNVNRYNLDFMNQAISMLAAILIISYIMYTVSESVLARIHTPYLYLTAIFVILALLRYLQITIVDVKSGSPTKVLMHDRFIQLCIAGWLLCFGIILYF